MNKVTIYTSTTCPHCHSAIDFLKELNVDFEETNVQIDTDARLELIKQKIMGVPAIFINDEVIVGFNKDKILTALNKH